MDHIQVNDTGLSILYTPQAPIVDIILVHGLQGHPRRTWTKTLSPTSASSKGRWTRLLGLGRHDSVERYQREVFWPADLLPNDCPDARILTFGYNSTITSFVGDTVNQNHPSANAKNLLYALSRRREETVSALLVLLLVSIILLCNRDISINSYCPP